MKKNLIVAKMAANRTSKKQLECLERAKVIPGFISGYVEKESYYNESFGSRLYDHFYFIRCTFDRALITPAQLKKYPLISGVRLVVGAEA